MWRLVLAFALSLSCSRVQLHCARSEAACAACNSDNCAGCCNGAVCVAQSGTAACGTGGADCKACDEVAPVCSLGACIAPGSSPAGGCGPRTCSGCCENGQCFPGDNVTHCGPAGGSCSPCGSPQLCTAGACVPTTGLYDPQPVADQELHPFGLALDDGAVYWTTLAHNAGDGTVMKVAKAGGPKLQLASAQASPSDLAVFEGFLYWANAGTRQPDAAGNVPGAGIVRVRTDGTAPAQEVVHGTSPLRLAVSAAGIFWTNQDGTIRHAGLDGSGAAVLIAHERPLDIAVDAASVYWTNGYQALLLNDAREIRKAPLAGGAALTLADREIQPASIALDGSFAYWTSTAGKVRRVPLAGGAIETLASGQPQPSDIAVDASGLYWANAINGQLMSLPAGAATPVVLAVGPQDVISIGVDARSIFWTDLQGASVSSVPRR